MNVYVFESMFFKITQVLIYNEDQHLIQIDIIFIHQISS